VINMACKSKKRARATPLNEGPTKDYFIGNLPNSNRGKGLTNSKQM